jgi:hypothetical protein
MFDRHGNPGQCYFCNYDGGGIYDQYETESWPLVAYQIQANQAGRQYIAWLCNECDDQERSAEFVASVRQEHELLAGVHFVSYPGTPYEGWSKLHSFNAQALLARFHNFQGALLRSVQLILTRERDQTHQAEPHGAVIVVAAHDREATTNDGWVTVTLDIDTVSEFVYSGSDRSWINLRKLSLGFIDNKFFLALDQEATTQTELLAAERRVAGERCLWTIGPFIPHDILPRPLDRPNNYTLRKAAGTLYDDDPP